MKIIILNYSNGVVYITTVPKNIENIDEYLYNTYNFKESEIYWMEFNGTVKHLNCTDYDYDKHK